MSAPKEANVQAVESELRLQDDVEAKPCPLLQLPPEIWSRICEYAVTSEKVIELNKSDNKELRFRGNKSIPPPITRVCKALREEAFALFYRSNEFVIYDTIGCDCGFRKWMYTIRDQDIRHITGLFGISALDDVPEHMQTLSHGGKNYFPRSLAFKEEWPSGRLTGGGRYAYRITLGSTSTYTTSGWYCSTDGQDWQEAAVTTLTLANPVNLLCFD